LPVYSHSRLSSFENCPLQYRFRYIDRVRTDFESIEAFMGKRVHEALELVYDDLDRAREQGVEAAVARFHEKWEASMGPNVRVIRPDMEPGYYREIGDRCVRTFWEINAPFRIDPEKIIGLEMKVFIALDKGGRYRMMGYVDRAQHAEPGVIEIHDYKTSASLPREGSLRYDRQLPLYEMGMRQKFPETGKVRLIWHYLAHGETFVEERTREQLDRTRRSCIALIQTVEKTRDFPAKKGPLCPWCSYQDTCPEWESEKPQASPAFPGGRPREKSEPSPSREATAASPEKAASPADTTDPKGNAKRNALTEDGEGAVASRAGSQAGQVAAETGSPAGKSETGASESQDKAPPEKRPAGRSRKDSGQLPLF
jgi:putative RecB family exonuclease